MEKQLLSIGATSKLLGVSIDTLRLWEKKGILLSFRPSPESKRYYRREDIDNFLSQGTQDIAELARNWVISDPPINLPPLFYCETIDVFQARLQRMEKELSKISRLGNLSSLIVAICGEIGNNSYNHNVGMWPDVPGTFFGYNLLKNQAVIADRGQGVLKTLKRVVPELKNEQKALKVAFTEYISAREPEDRGNGLKFVRDIITSYPISLKFHSGNAILQIEKETSALKIEKSDFSFHGCLALIDF